MLTSEHKAVKKFSPGYFILEQVEIRKWILESLASRMQIPDGELDSLLHSRIPISEEVAQKLGEVFKTSAEYWLNIDKGYRTWLPQRKE